MGLSKVIGLKATILLAAFYCLKVSGMTVIPLLLLHASIVSYLVAIASHPSINLPLLLGKSSDGRFPIWAMIIFGPFLVFIRVYVFLRRLKSSEPMYNEISEGLYVGGWPSSLGHVPPGEPALIDCTCELPRSAAVSRNAYLCIATWDTRSPRPSQIESAVRWACMKRSQKKPVYIHCAHGHGRSVCVMCALLVALGLAEDWKSAEKMIREKRPGIRMNVHHRKTLEEWSKNRISSKGASSAILSDNSS